MGLKARPKKTAKISAEEIVQAKQENSLVRQLRSMIGDEHKGHTLMITPWLLTSYCRYYCIDCESSIDVPFRRAGALNPQD